MGLNSFFAKVPKAERAFLSAYKSGELNGKYGIRIELQPLLFADPTLHEELGPEVILDHLSLPSAAPVDLQNTRFVPDTSEPPPFRYEGSCYFLGEHNWVDLREIRFLQAEDDAIWAEYDVVVHLPINPPNEYPLSLIARTKVETGATDLAAPRNVEGLGTFIQAKDGTWQCQGVFEGKPVQIELRADGPSFEQIGEYAKSVILERGITSREIRNELKEWLGMLQWKFDEFKVATEFNADDFVPRTFYFYQRRHHKEPELIIVLDHPSDVGHWSLSFVGTKSSDMNWVPKN